MIGPLLKPQDYTDRLKFISTPTQIIWGNEDAWIPVSNATLFEKELPNTVINIMQKNRSHTNGRKTP